MNIKELTLAKQKIETQQEKIKHYRKRGGCGGTFRKWAKAQMNEARIDFRKESFNLLNEIKQELYDSKQLPLKDSF